ncbi:unnamed protein product [Pieris macdunnoughi]|uniref:Uncharacterized protein n=1 Tax=Pieris macdunnoughi TaxID=345717 RepID=A0A821M204_9NEOP|nr:unnamed protein product [Pieris macdunnoughi]
MGKRIKRFAELGRNGFEIKCTNDRSIQPDNFHICNTEAIYGPYKATYDTYEICKGPKMTDCGDVKLNNLQNYSNVIYSLDFRKRCSITKAKVVIAQVKDSNRTNKLWNYQLSKPCQHFVLGPILKKAFNLSDNCMVAKGHYEVPINMHEINANFLGGSFFYDTYSFKVIAYNDRYNFICVYCVVVLSPL